MNRLLLGLACGVLLAGCGNETTTEPVAESTAVLPSSETSVQANNVQAASPSPVQSMTAGVQGVYFCPGINHSSMWAFYPEEGWVSQTLLAHATDGDTPATPAGILFGNYEQQGEYLSASFRSTVAPETNTPAAIPPEKIQTILYKKLDTATEKTLALKKAAVAENEAFKQASDEIPLVCEKQTDRNNNVANLKESVPAQFYEGNEKSDVRLQDMIAKLEASAPNAASGASQ